MSLTSIKNGNSVSSVKMFGPTARVGLLCLYKVSITTLIDKVYCKTSFSFKGHIAVKLMVNADHQYKCGKESFRPKKQISPATYTCIASVASQVMGVKMYRVLIVNAWHHIIV